MDLRSFRAALRSVAPAPQETESPSPVRRPQSIIPPLPSVSESAAGSDGAWPEKWTRDGILGLRYNDEGELIVCDGSQPTMRAYRFEAPPVEPLDFVRPPRAMSMDTYQLVGHLIQLTLDLSYKGVDRVRFYLPSGVELIEDHLDQVERLISRMLPRNRRPAP